MPYRSGMLFRRTYEAAKAYGYCEFVKLRNPGEPSGAEHGYETYPELLARLWRNGQGVILLEHDVVPYQESIEEIASCPEPWCGYGYLPAGGVSAFFLNFGCTKISAELIAATRDTFETRWPPHWNACDVRLSAYAVRAGYRPHRHLPNVQHRAARRYKSSPLGDDFIEIDHSGEPIGEIGVPYEPLRAPKPPTSYYMDDGIDHEQQGSMLGAPTDLDVLDRFNAMLSARTRLLPDPPPEPEWLQQANRRAGLFWH